MWQVEGQTGECSVDVTLALFDRLLALYFSLPGQRRAVCAENAVHANIDGNEIAMGAVGRKVHAKAKVGKLSFAEET